MSKLLDHFLDLLYPTRCILCRKGLTPGRPRFCDQCLEALPQPERGVYKKGDYYSKCVSALYYEGAVSDAIQRYKFQGAQAYAHAFGELVAACIYEELEGEYDMLSWVPLAPDRYHDRGYDQAELLAANAAKRLLKPLTPTLKKRRWVPAQSLSGGPEKRRANIAGAYRVLDPLQIAGKRILLVDDIVTSGSTLSECAKTLLLAGAEEVLCATLARTR